MTALDPAYLQSYIDRLNAHDWHYEKTDDARVWKAGQAAQEKLRREASTDPVLFELYHARSDSKSDLTNGQKRMLLMGVTFDEFCAVIVKRNARDAKAPPDTAQRLAMTVKTLAGALLRADPDNRLPQRAMEFLRTLGLLEGVMTQGVTGSQGKEP